MVMGEAQGQWAQVCERWGGTAEFTCLFQETVQESSSCFLPSVEDWVVPFPPPSWGPKSQCSLGVKKKAIKRLGLEKSDRETNIQAWMKGL